LSNNIFRNQLFFRKQLVLRWENSSCNGGRHKFKRPYNSKAFWMWDTELCWWDQRQVAKQLSESCWDKHFSCARGWWTKKRARRYHLFPCN